MMPPGDDGLVETVNREAEKKRAGFYERAHTEHLAPLWRVLHGLVTTEPKHSTQPALWKYANVRPYLMEACDLISTEESERRVLVLENPGLPGQSRITQSLFCGLQVILPGEIAPAHRHVASALRFVVEGRDAYTAIAGERTTMKPGDFVITPSWTWHDHGNESDAPMVWIDGLDMHIVNLLGASFRENYPGKRHPSNQPEGSSHAIGGCNMLPIGFDRRSQTSPLFSYPYDVARESLHALCRAQAPDPCHAYKMLYINPVTGGSAMPTLTTAMQLLPKGFTTTPYRSTAGTVFAVVEGSGKVVIDGTSFAYGAKDIFVIPSWARFTVESTDESVIFSFSDRVVQEKLDLFRESRGDE
jgi:gentisate 1,2-dioxygenase